MDSATKTTRANQHVLVLCCELPGSCITGCHWGEGQRYVATKEKTESCSPSLLQLTLKPLARFQTRLIANSLNLEAAKRCWRWKYSVSLNHSNGVTFSDIIQPKDSFPSNEMGRTSYKAVATKSLSFLSHPLLSLAPPPLPPPVSLTHSPLPLSLSSTAVRYGSIAASAMHAIDLTSAIHIISHLVNRDAAYE